MEDAPLHAGPSPPGGRAVWLRAADGVRLRAGFWPAPAAHGTILLFPGRTEVVEKYAAVAATLTAAGWGVLTLDWRGQGLSDRAGRDPALGHVGGFAEYQADVTALLGAAPGLGAARPWMVLSHSMGGCIALRALMEGLPVAAAAFSAPMWGLPLGRAARLAVRGAALAGRVTGHGLRAVPGNRSDFDLAHAAFDDNFLTTDRTQFDRMQAQVRRHPDLSLGAPTLGWLAAALVEMAALAPRPAPALPALAGVGSLEKIVDPAAIAARMAHWPGGTLRTFRGAEHELMMEAPQHRDRFLDAVLALFDTARTRDGG